MIYDNTVVGILADTHAANEALLEQAHGAVQAFYDSKPKRPCVACGGPFTITVGDNGLREWRCDKCGRTETTLAELTAERQQKAINNTAPPPPAAPTKADARAKLTAAVARRGDAHQHERTIDAALDNARSARATAEDALDTAAANLKTAEFGAAEALAKAARAGNHPPWSRSPVRAKRYRMQPTPLRPHRAPLMSCSANSGRPRNTQHFRIRRCWPPPSLSWARRMVTSCNAPSRPCRRSSHVTASFPGYTSITPFLVLMSCAN